MTDHISTPGSNGDSSINIGKTGAPKDRACPFCRQQFTSSSLGRHLDLYVREKNPKPADGIHNIDEIRKMREGITRRQPRRSSMTRRDDSTPSGTPAANGAESAKRTPQPEGASEHELKSSSGRREQGDFDLQGKKHEMRTIWHKASWQATGVINDIPSIKQNGDSGKWDHEDAGKFERRTADGKRTVSKQILAKTTFEHKQKMSEALDTARAAELALREILGSIRAAK